MRLCPLLCLSLALASATTSAQGTTLACNPQVSHIRVVATAAARQFAGQHAQPPMTGGATFAWADTPLGVTSSPQGLMFFGSNGGGHIVDGVSRGGSAVRTIGTLNNPLGTAAPQDVVIARNPDPSVDPNYPSYTYLGGGPVYRVPTGMPGAGQLLMVTHAEITTPDTQPSPSFYSLLGLAASADNGATWTDLGEIIRINHPYAASMDGFEIGDPPLVVTPDGQFQIYFRDWNGNGALAGNTTNISVARASVSAVLAAAFGTQPYAAPFTKYYQGQWDQPGIGGLSSELPPGGFWGEERQVVYDADLQRFVAIMAGGAQIGYAESTDGLNWSTPVTLLSLADQNAIMYAMPVGIGADPTILGRRFNILFTWYPTDGGGWQSANLQRLTVVCR